MIVSINHKGLRLFWEKDDPSKLPAAQVEKIRRMLTVIDTMRTVNVLSRFPGYKLHALTGNLKGFWSITVTANYRLIFKFKDEKVFDLDFIDYH
jgi:toxin HigB-1